MERRRNAARIALLALLVGPLAPTSARATDDGILRVADARAGMRGYGLTVFRGTEPERFDVEVIGVLHNFLPRQDILLIRCSHPMLDHAGIVAGMSGSPIYIEGKLAGALAYGWRFAKDPIAGVTPIEYMLAELRRPVRGLPGVLPSSRPSGRNRARPRWIPPPRGVATASAHAHARADPYWSSFAPGSNDALVPAATPLGLAGFAPRVRDALEDALASFGLVPVQGAAGGARRTQPGATAPGLVEGGAIGVQLMRGDMDATGVGTVTTVRGRRVLAFGHPMFNAGEQYFPVTTARVHAFLASLQRSFKIAEPIDEVGTLVEDRQSCIIADTGTRARMVPIHIRLRPDGAPEDVFDVEVAQHRFLTPTLAFSAVSNALSVGLQDVADVTFTARSRLVVAGHAPLVLVDHAWTPAGAGDPRSISTLRSFAAMGAVLMNPFEDARIERFDVDLDVRYVRDVVDIEGIHVNRDEVDAGDRISVFVTERPFGRPERVRAVDLDVPREAAGKEMEIEVASGDRVQPDLADPEDLDGLLYNLAQAWPATSMVVSMRLPSVGVTLRGHVVGELPPSALDTLRPVHDTIAGAPFATRRRIIVPVGSVVEGRETVRVRVRPIR